MGETIIANPPPEAAADWTIDQGWESYTPAEHALWLTLYDRQAALLPGRACAAFLSGLQALDLRGQGVPDFERINQRLAALTGWRVVAVPGLVPDDVFFEHLANRRFPAGRFIRRPEQIDYLQEPDVFHDVFGHVPMLTDPTFADYLQAYGEGGRRALGLGQLTHLARLYWYTVEFGLTRDPEGLRIYGAGIVSSHARPGSAWTTLAQPPGLRSGAGDAHPLPHRRLPAGLFRRPLAGRPPGGDPAGLRTPLSAAARPGRHPHRRHPPRRRGDHPRRPGPRPRPRRLIGGAQAPPHMCSEFGRVQAPPVRRLVVLYWRPRSSPGGQSCGSDTRHIFTPSPGWESSTSGTWS